jgi:hypothetical protein
MTNDRVGLGLTWSGLELEAWAGGHTGDRLGADHEPGRGTVGLSTYALRWYEQEGKIGLYDRTEG